MSKKELQHEVTIMSTDISGSTQLIQNLDVEEARKILGNCVELMMDVVDFFQGTVLETGGDGIVAIFEGEQDSMSSAKAACYSGLMIRNLLDLYQFDLRVRVGLHTDHGDFHSEAIEKSKMIESNAEANDVCLSRETLENLGSFVNTTETKGRKDAEMELYRVTSLSKNDLKKYDELLANYIKKHEKSSYHEEPMDIVGERKFISILFIKDYSPELKKEITTLIEGEGGTVLKTTHNTMLCIFGAPIAYEDHAIKACRAALNIKDLLVDCKDCDAFTMGIHSGEAVVDLIGSAQQKHYDVLGASVSLAARMQQHAQSREIYISSATSELVKNGFYLKLVGEISVKGFSHEISTYSLLKEKSYREKALALATPHTTIPLIGRDKEIQVFTKAVASVIEGRGQVIELGSEAGGGKSRLMYEFEKILNEKDINYLQIACFLSNKVTPLYPIAQLMRMAFDLDESMPVDAQLKKLKEVLEKFELHNEHEFSAFCYLFHFPIHDEKWKNLDATTRFQYIYKSVFHYFKEICNISPFFVAIEDLQWCDTQSLECISFMIENAGKKRLLIGLNYRSEEFNRKSLPNKPYSHILEMAALDEENSHKLFKFLLPHDATIDNLEAVIVRRCAGNPFFLKETVKSLIEEGAVTIDERKYVLTKKGEKYNLPDSIRTLLNSRIDRLEPEEKQLIQVASIVGRVFSKTILFLIAPEAKVELLEKLKEKEFIYELASGKAGEEYEFNHALTRDAIYFDMLKTKREYYHGQLALKLEKFHQLNIEEYYAIIAEHADKGNIYKIAFKYYHLLGPRMFNMGLHVESLNNLYNAERCFEQIHDYDTDTISKYIYNQSYIMHTKPMIGQTTPYSAEDEERILKMAGSVTDDTTLAFLYISLSIQYSNNGYVEKSFQVLEKAKVLVERIKEETLLHYYRFFLQYAYQISGKYLETEQETQKILASENNIHYFAFEAPIISGAYYHLCYAYADQGLYEKCFSIVNKLRKTEKFTPIVNFSTVFLSICHFVPDVIFGKWEDLKEIAQYAENRYEHMMYGLPMIILGPCMAMYEAIYEKKGEYTHLNAAYGFYSSMPSFVYKVAYSSTWLIEALLRLSESENDENYKRARNILDKLSSYCEHGQTKPVLARYLKLEARYLMVENRRENYVKIRSLLEQALTLATEIEMYSETAYIQADLALFHKFYTKDLETAQEFYKIAMEGFDSMNMGFWGEMLHKDYEAVTYSRSK